MNGRDMFDLTGKVALVTGGSRGLGMHMARGLGEVGASVAITARGAEELEEVRAELASEGITVVAIPHDLAAVNDAARLVDRVVAELGDIDILVNNAALAINAPTETLPAEEWNRVMDVNINALFFLTQETARRCMIPRRTGKIINISSTAGLGGTAIDSPLLAPYTASKGAVLSLTRGLATEWGKYNINVNAIVPGTFPSSMTEATLPSAHNARVLSKTPLQRVGGADDIKGVAIFFACEASRHLSGQFVFVDGGAFTTNYPAVEAFTSAG